MRPLLLLALLSTAMGCTAVVDAGSYSVFTCDPVTGEGCGEGRSCFALISTGEHECIFEGSRSTGSVCGAKGECVGGATCYFYTPESGLCLDYCRGPADCTGQPDSIGCNLNEATGIGACYQGCDPADPGSCGAGVACFAMGTASLCNTTGPIGLLSPCGFTFETACQPGFMCLTNNMGNDVCFVQCGPGLAGCGPEETCTYALGDDIRPAEAGEWGVCATLS